MVLPDPPRIPRLTMTVTVPQALRLLHKIDKVYTYRTPEFIRADRKTVVTFWMCGLVRLAGTVLHSGAYVSEYVPAIIETFNNRIWYVFSRICITCSIVLEYCNLLMISTKALKRTHP